ncbi:MAG TPA: hypothetical protein VNP73_09615 [Actinomycetota bacterium]|nr:hypothetical protein [Actinomycetota bacterium]
MPGTQERRSLKYIRLAAFLASQPAEVDQLEMKLEEIEDVVGEKLPNGARFPAWWRNDSRRMHSRAWLTAGWRVEGFNGDGIVRFERQANDGAN